MSIFDGTLPSALAFVCFVWFLIRRSKLSYALTLTSATGALAIWAFIDWIFRDGLGPDSDSSEGVQALQNFASGFWLPLAFWVVIVSTTIALRKRKTSD